MKTAYIILFLFALALLSGVVIFQLKDSAIPSGVDVSTIPEATPIGDIKYEQIQADTSINAVIDSSQKLDNGNLLVKFHHNSVKEEPVSVIGAVRYELSKTTAKPNEVITLTVFDWSTEYFDIKVGKASSVVGFGKKMVI